MTWEEVIQLTSEAGQDLKKRSELYRNEDYQKAIRERLAGGGIQSHIFMRLAYNGDW